MVIDIVCARQSLSSPSVHQKRVTVAKNIGSLNVVIAIVCARYSLSSPSVHHKRVTVAENKVA